MPGMKHLPYEPLGSDKERQARDDGGQIQDGPCTAEALLPATVQPHSTNHARKRSQEPWREKPRTERRGYRIALTEGLIA
jgi:hypothetical protein